MPMLLSLVIFGYSSPGFEVRNFALTGVTEFDIQLTNVQDESYLIITIHVSRSIPSKKKIIYSFSPRVLIFRIRLKEK
jgi:hypothetical protein